MAMAALDALVVDSIAEAIPELARQGKLGPTVEKWVKDQPESFLSCFASSDPAEALGVMCKEHLGHQTFQRSAAIEGVLRDAIGVTGIWEEAAKQLSKKTGKSHTATEVAERLDVYVSRRNRIAHGGDLKEGSSSTAPIRRKFLVESVQTTRAAGQAVAKLVAARSK